MATTPSSSAAPLETAIDLMRRADAVLFDFNGTLSLDEEILEQAYESALTGLGLAGMGPGEYAGLMGRSELDICRALLEARDTSTPPDRLLRRLTASYRGACTGHPPVPASHRRLVEELTAHGTVCAVVTGTIRPMVEPVLESSGLAEVLGCVVTIEDIEHGKPDPEGFLLARRLLGLPVDAACVVVEDSRSGVEAASRAGMSSIAVNPGLPGASVTVSSLSALSQAWGPSTGLCGHPDTQAER